MRWSENDLVGIDMATGADDNVLRTASDVDVTTGDVGEIATVKPITVKQLAVLRGIVEIAARGRRTTKLEPPFLSLAKLAGRADDANLMSWQGAAAGNELKCGEVVRCCGQGAPLAREPGTINAIDDRGPSQRGKG